VSAEEWRRECIYAHTQSCYQRYPGYVNVSRCVNGDYEITVRSAESVGTGQLRVSKARFLELVEALATEAHSAKK
jgi:hypothetical protein